MKQTEKEPNIFDVLFAEKICFAVYTNVKKYKRLRTDAWERDYYVVIHKIDYLKFPRLLRCLFVKAEDYDDVFQYILFVAEEKAFKEIKEEYFEKVFHEAEGRVYELKDNSFKKYWQENRVLA